MRRRVPANHASVFHRPSGQHEPLPAAAAADRGSTSGESIFAEPERPVAKEIRANNPRASDGEREPSKVSLRRSIGRAELSRFPHSLPPPSDRWPSRDLQVRKARKKIGRASCRERGWESG